MYVVLGLLGAAIGGPAGFLLVGAIFSLANPGKGCMDGLRVIPWLPFMFLSLLVGAATGQVLHRAVHEKPSYIDRFAKSE